MISTRRRPMWRGAGGRAGAASAASTGAGVMLYFDCWGTSGNLPFVSKVLRTVQSPGASPLQTPPRDFLNLASSTRPMEHERPHAHPVRRHPRSALQAHPAVSARRRYRAVPEDHVRGRAGREGAGQGHAGGDARGAARAERGRVRRHQSLSAAGASAAAAQYPRRQGGQPQRQVRRAGFSEERQHRRRRRAADVPGHRHRDHHGQEGSRVITDGDDEAALSEGARDAYLRRNLRYSQVAPLSMYEEKNTANNMPAQCEIYAEGDDAYKFMFMAKGGGSRQQELSVPGDAVGSDQRPHAGVPEGEGADARAPRRARPITSPS